MSRNSIVYGPADEIFNTTNSIGTYIFEYLQKRNVDDVLFEDAISKERLTCGQSLERSIKLVDILKRFAVAKGDIVSIISENDIHFFSTLLACFFMGAVAYPLNPAYKEGELKNIFESVKTKLVICSENVLGTIQEVKKKCNFLVLLLNSSSTYCDTLSVETLSANISVDVSSFTPITVDNSDSEAIILCSSGTTGLPKGVTLTHRNMIHVALSSRYMMSVVNSKATIQIVPSFHMYGTIVQFGVILSQMKLIIMNGFKPELFLKTIEEDNIAAIFGVPQVVGFLAKSSLVEKYDISSLKYVISAAAQLPSHLTNLLLERQKGINVLQFYGLTEVSGLISLQTQNNYKIDSVGTLLPGVAARICCRETQNVLDPSQAGEICLKGTMIMKGYFNNDAATKQCIDKDLFFHTGDIGYFDEDNCLYIVDRLKDIIKYKGFQVSPNELENLILKHPSVKECGVIGISDERDGEVSLAFVVKNDDATVTEQEIVDFVAQRISVQKHLHGGVRFLKSLPRTSTGKIQRQKLRELSTCSPKFQQINGFNQIIK